MTDLSTERLIESRNMPHSRADIFLAVCIIAVSVAYYIGAIYTCFNNDTPMCFGSTNSPPDFNYLWVLSYIQHWGDLSQLYDPAYVLQQQMELTGRTEEYAWAYPPHSLFLLWPLSLLPLVPAYLVWVSVGLMLLLWSCSSFTRFRLSFTIALLLSPAVFVNTFAGHNGFFTAALLIGGILLASRRPIIAGVLFGLLTVKPQLGLLVPVLLVAARLWQPLVSAMVTGIALILASVMIHGVELWAAFIQNSSGSAVSILRHSSEHVINMMPTVFMAGRILELPGPVIVGTQISVALVVIGTTYAVIRRNNDPVVWAAIVSVGTFLVSPTAFLYDMVIMSAGVLLLVFNSRQEDFLQFERIELMLLWALPVLTIFFNAASIPIAPLVLVVGFIYIVARGLRGPCAPASREASQT